MTWITAGKALGADPAASVACPVCEKENLVVQDVFHGDSDKFDRILSCPGCGSRNILGRMSKNAAEISG
jgi:DNA-directed RNA polymerase subunit RPC12/RpoP